jgi:SAM-dependent methyltransferase
MAPVTTTNSERNRVHYDTQFATITAAELERRLATMPAFLTDAVATDTSWRAMYSDGLSMRLTGTHVLELGAGDGFNALVMAWLGATVVANDISPVGLEQAAIAARAAGLSARFHVLVCDAVDLDIAGPFDLVVGKAFLHHLTHDVEDAVLRRVATLLTPNGEARFVEPAVNSRLLDQIRWLVPVPGRPSKLQRAAYAAWKQADPHPERDNRDYHFHEVGQRYFAQVETWPMGGLERLHRLIPGDPRRLRRRLHELEMSLPRIVARLIARSQTIVYRKPLL